MNTLSIRTEDCTRVKSLWFDDAGLVLQVGLKLFKIYPGFLAARSTVFNDMFTLPLPPTGDDAYDGCHLVRVPDDGDEYFSRLLAQQFSPVFPFRELGGILRLAHKYDVPKLKAGALEKFEEFFPVSLENHEKLCSSIQRLWPQGKISPHPVAAIAHIFQEVGALWLFQGSRIRIPFDNLRFSHFSSMLG
ncbi:hypothetical protein DL96DRAFT_1534420 [Flagelloscypha sp. PMI_526]|nr:hypothetical protein DL96DRAFT_1534420 [Flagelloscypha sp. PMI_526]